MRRIRYSCVDGLGSRILIAFFYEKDARYHDIMKREPCVQDHSFSENALLSGLAHLPKAWKNCMLAKARVRATDHIPGEQCCKE
jgi:hypothetical protein